MRKSGRTERRRRGLDDEGGAMKVLERRSGVAGRNDDVGASTAVWRRAGCGVDE